MEKGVCRLVGRKKGRTREREEDLLRGGLIGDVLRFYKGGGNSSLAAPFLPLNASQNGR